MRFDSKLGSGFGGDNMDPPQESMTDAQAGMTPTVAKDNTAASALSEPGVLADSAATATAASASTDTGEAAQAACNASAEAGASGPPGTTPAPPRAGFTAAATAVPHGCTLDTGAARVTPPRDLPQGSMVNIQDGTILVPVTATNMRNRPFLVAAHTVTIGQFLVYAEAASKHGWARHLAEKASSLRFADPDHPITGLTFTEAVAYAQWAGLELLSPDEWTYAAAGPDGRRFPWGNDFLGGTHCQWAKNRGGATTCRVFDYAEGCSPSDLYNSAGNVGEWCRPTSSPLALLGGPNPGLLLPPQVAGVVPRPVMGGSWASTQPTQLVCTARVYRLACVRADDIGFRLMLPIAAGT